MATIESSPLPPPGFVGQLAKITEADRAELMAQANDVIDFYLNGPGSFTPDGPRKPPVNAPEYDSTVRDLKNFKASVLTSKQYADDPSHILDSVVRLVDDTIDQLNQVAGDRDPTDRDRIIREPSDPNAVHERPITLQAPNPPETPGLDLSPSPSPSQNPRRSEPPVGAAPILTQAASPSVSAFTSLDANAPASLFSRLLSAGPNSPLAADMTSPPLQPDQASNVADNGPTRFLARRTYDPSQGSPFTTLPLQPSPDGSLSLNGAYLEYLRRLNAS
jgi:hypothetical protein